MSKLLRFNADLIHVRDLLHEFYSGSEIEEWINAAHPNAERSEAG
jgi:hypothetical protein